MKKIYFFLALMLALYSLPSIQTAQAEYAGPHLNVVTIEREPFVIQEADKLTGFSIELWEAIASTYGWYFEYEVVDSFVDLLRPVREGNSNDVAIANISITADREEVMDFSNSIYSSGLQIMTPRQSPISQILEGLADPIALNIYAALAFALILCAHLALLGRIDVRKCRRAITSGYMVKNFLTYLRCLGNNIWWIITLGGFGRNLPSTVSGRLSILFWIFSAVISILLMVAHFTSFLTTHKQSESLTYQDLRGLSVGTTIGSTSEAFLRKQKITTTSYDDIHELFADVSAGKLDAVVHDAPILQYYIATKGSRSAHIASQVFNPEQYGIALPEGSELREEINTAILRLRENGTYDEIYRKWFE